MEDQVRLLMEVNAQLSTLLQAEMKQNQTLTAKIDELLQQIDELSHKKNSRNSSAPPFSDGYAKPAPKSQRKSSVAKPGGQDGHKGSSMKLMNAPDEIREHSPKACSGCPNRERCHASIAEGGTNLTLLWNPD